MPSVGLHLPSPSSLFEVLLHSPSVVDYHCFNDNHSVVETALSKPSAPESDREAPISNLGLTISRHSTLSAHISDPSTSVELTVHSLDLPLRSLVVFNCSPVSFRFHPPCRTVASMWISVRTDSWRATWRVAAGIGLAEVIVCWLH